MAYIGPDDLGLVVWLGGCVSSPLESFLDQQASRRPTRVIAECIKGVDKELSAEESGQENAGGEKEAINRFLDCIFETKVPEDNLEWRLVRGHAVVALISMYGAYSLQYSPLYQKEDAQRLQGRVIAAEKSMWEMSRFRASPPPYSNEMKLLLEDAAHDDRMLDVLQVATAAMNPAKRRAVGFFERLGNVIVAPTPQGAVGLVRNLRDAVKRAAVVEIKGSDYIQGTTKLMQNIRDRKNGIPDKEDWKAIDAAYLAPACRTISFMADGNFDKSCSPAR